MDRIVMTHSMLVLILILSQSYHYHQCFTALGLWWGGRTLGPNPRDDDPTQPESHFSAVSGSKRLDDPPGRRREGALEQKAENSTNTPT